MSAPVTPESDFLRTLYAQIATDAGIPDPLGRAVEVLDATWMEAPSMGTAEFVIALLHAPFGGGS